MTNKPILCLDFDGVCHMYTSPWTQPWEIADGPVPGLFPFLEEAMAHFQIAIFSSRSMYANGREAMQEWFDKHAREHYHARLGLEREHQANALVGALDFPAHKPAAFVSLDDRTLLFQGQWPHIGVLRGFIPWNQHMKKRGNVEKAADPIPKE